KGVVITHRNVCVFIDWAVGHFGLTPEDRISGHPPMHFDLSVFDIFGAMAAGASLHPVPPKMNVMAPAVARFIRDQALPQWFSVPSVLNYLVKAGAVEEGDFPELRRLLWCGEVLHTPTLVYLMRRLPHVDFTNLYPPTEATIASSYHRVMDIPDPEADIPIGRACDGESLLVLDDDLQPVPEGETAHLFVAGEGLSPGYWRDPEKTEAAFLCPPPESRLPAHMVPTTFLGYSRLPTNPHGKVDRKVLLVAFQDSPGVSWS
ncbi:MAG: AMP-binding protein, partial [Gemmatimonadales bacterium]